MFSPINYNSGGRVRGASQAMEEPQQLRLLLAAAITRTFNIGRKVDHIGKKETFSSGLWYRYNIAPALMHPCKRVSVSHSSKWTITKIVSAIVCTIYQNSYHAIMNSPLAGHDPRTGRFFIDHRSTHSTFIQKLHCNDALLHTLLIIFLQTIEKQMR